MNKRVDFKKMKKTANYETGSFEKKTANGDFLSSKKTAKKLPMPPPPKSPRADSPLTAQKKGYLSDVKKNEGRVKTKALTKRQLCYRLVEFLVF